MTVYPFVIHFGRFEVTGYGIMMMLSFLVGGWIYAREVQRRGLDTAIAWDTVLFAVLGGLAGAKIYYAASVGRWDALFARGGLVWYGGFAGGAACVFAYMWWKRLPVRTLLDLISPSLAVGYLLGRVGCFLVNDDYGVPTDLPWGMAYPRGTPPSTARVLADQFGVAIPAGTPPDQVMAVHPTQLYEVALMFAVFWLLWRVRAHRHGPTWLFGLYLVLSGLSRFAVEFVRAKSDRVLGAVSLAQVLSAALVLLGVGLMARYRMPEASPADESPD